MEEIVAGTFRLRTSTVIGASGDTSPCTHASPTALPSVWPYAPLVTCPTRSSPDSTDPRARASGRIVQPHRQQPAIAGSFLPFAERLAPHESLVKPNREAQPHLVRIVERPHVVPPPAEPAFQTEPVEREPAGVAKMEILARFDDPTV